MNVRHHLVVLGLDSLPPRLVSTLAKTGVMPFMNELLKKGAFGTLYSVVPSNTGSSWNSAWTGQPPRRHSFFGFYHYDLKDDIIRISTSDRLKVPTVWQILNAHGLKVLVINSPMQYPASKLEGVMVSGFMAPSLNLASVYPRAFRDNLAREIPDYIFDVPWDKHKVDDTTFEANISSVINVFHQRVAVAKLAAENGTWDVLMVVFKSIDNMLHYTWDYISDDRSNIRRRELSLKAFRALDDACRQIALLAGYPRTNILVCSDHGHGPVKGHLFVNRLLWRWGFLLPQTKSSRTLNKFLTSCRKRLGKDKTRMRPPIDIGTRLKVQWGKSQAVMISGGIIYLNVKGRQPEGLVRPEQYQSLRERIANRLKSLRNETDGSALIDKVECPEEAASKPVPASEPTVPDILFQATDGVVLRRCVTKGPIWRSGRPNNIQGCHYIGGTILCAGPAFTDGGLVKGNLPDVAPTIIAACGLPIPQGLVGKPIMELFPAETRIRYDTEGVSRVEAVSESSGAYTVDDEDIIRGRLTNLGYMD